MKFILAFAICFIISLIVTPFVKKLAIKIGAVDQPNHRKVHQRVMPRLGGLAIALTFMLGFFMFTPDLTWTWPVMAGAAVIVITGVLDDLYELSAKVKFGAQIFAAVIAVIGGVQIDFITLPSGDLIGLGYLAIPLTILWIVGITNSINLIDGLDGLAAGVSSIVLLTISILAITMGLPLIALMSLLMLGSTTGFLVYNFHPAKIFMGDTGSLFLGFMISVLSVAGLFKNVALFSLVVPLIVLGVPILDTLFAIIRRYVQKQPLTKPDKFHLHHCLLNLGFSHRQTVGLIYAISCLFSLAAIIFTRATLWGSTLLLVALIIVIELIVETTGLISSKYRPLLNLVESRRMR